MQKVYPGGNQNDYFYRVMDEGKISKMFTEPMIWVNSSANGATFYG